MFIRGEVRTRRVWIDNIEIFPDEGQYVVSHSPDGFNWGYDGSGPAQLALSILLAVGCPRGQAFEYYEDFKREVVRHWLGDFATEINIAEWLERKESQVPDEEVQSQ